MGAVGDPVEKCPNKKKKSDTVEFQLVDSDDRPYPGQRYRIEFEDESVLEGVAGKDGKVKLTGVPKGGYKLSFPDLDAHMWDKA